MRKHFKVIDKKDNWWYCQKSEEEFDEALPLKRACYMDSKIFSRCPFLDKIFKRYDVVCVTILGSYVKGDIDEYSDYDINVFVNGDCDTNHNAKDEFMIYNGRKLHWYYNNIYDMFSLDHNLENYHQYFEFLFMKDVHILYKNPVYDKWINCLLENNSDIGKCGLYAMYNEFYERYTKFILEEKTISENMLTKKLAALLQMSYCIFHDINKNSFDLLMYAKRCRWLDYNETLMKRIYNRVVKLDKFMKEAKVTNELLNDKLFEIQKELDKTVVGILPANKAVKIR